MKKVLIISNFFPPNTLTPSERIYSWAKYFPQSGLYPIVLTRIWEKDTIDYSDSIKNAGSVIDKQITNNYTVYFLPYKNDWGEKIMQKLNTSKLKTIYKGLLFIYSFMEPIFLIRIAPYYRSVYKYSRKLLKQDNDIESVLISGAPFMLFKIGYLLKKKYKGINFFADYRDDWTTSEICFNPNHNKFMEYLRTYLKHFEKKWLSAYSLFFGVSENYVYKIKSLIGKNGKVATNGFMPENYRNISDYELYESFTITYVGYIYPTQPIEIFLSAIEQLIINYKIDIKVKFIGLLNQPDQAKRISEKTKNISKNIEILSRISKTECIKIQSESHLLLIVGHEGLKGTPGSKMYEYIALKKPVLICPSDKDIVEETLLNSGQGLIANNLNSCIDTIKEIYEKWSLGNNNLYGEMNYDYINSFDRQVIASKIANSIISVTTEEG